MIDHSTPLLKTLQWLPSILGVESELPALSFLPLLLLWSHLLALSALLTPFQPLCLSCCSSFLPQGLSTCCFLPGLLFPSNPPFTLFWSVFKWCFLYLKGTVLPPTPYTITLFSYSALFFFISTCFYIIYLFVFSFTTLSPGPKTEPGTQ